MADDGDMGGGTPGARDGDGAASGPPGDSSTQLLEANRRLRESAQRRDDLLTLLASDLHGPAAALLRHVRRLRAGEAGLAQAERRTLEVLERQARRVASVAEALLALNTLESGRVPLDRRPVELSGLLARVVEARAAQAQARGVAVSLDLPPADVVVPADAARLEDAAGALLDAAVAATVRGDRVRVALAALPEGARITVADGRPAAEVRGTALRGATGRHAGLGVALAAARTVAELHGGALEVSMRDDGRVSEITLPASLPAPARGAPHASAEPRAQVLVVDDDPDAREALAMMLGDDYDVALAADGREAVDRALAAPPSVVLMDLFMPRMDGLAALEALRQESATADVPVILISARGDEIVRSRSLDLGAVDFLQKPFSGRELKARLERTLRLTRRETQLQALAWTDALTGLANLRAFRSRLDEEVKRARRYHTPLACVMVDMDNLKPINDALGHGAGDAAIGAVADVVRRELRETDFAARYGGDEFVLLLPHTAAVEARVFAERVCARLRASTVEVRGHVLPLQASFGIAALGDEPIAEAGDLLVRRADAALYAAKREGRGRVAAHPTARLEERDPDAAVDDAAPAPS